MIVSQYHKLSFIMIIGAICLLNVCLLWLLSLPQEPTYRERECTTLFVYSENDAFTSLQHLGIHFDNMLLLFGRVMLMQLFTTMIPR